MKKVLSIVLSIAMVVCLAPTMAFAATTNAQADTAYSDIAGKPCEGAVNVLSALGVVDGFTDGTYKPEQTVTRAQMAKLVVTALGVADYATAKVSKYTDMGAATWAIPYVEYASNLNIVNGVGNGKFNPNGLVTYEQAVTMIVRALGYTDQCKEMNGTWPAIYVQKGMALGIFSDVVNGGANGATRGDIAVMLFNAIDLPEVYADGDGATQYKSGSQTFVGTNGNTFKGTSMLATLNKDGGRPVYRVLTATDADGAVTNIRSLVAAVGKVYTNKDSDVITIGDLKSEFVTGTINAAGDKLTAVDGTKYTIDKDAFATVDSTTGTIESARTVPYFVNGAKADDIDSLRPTVMENQQIIVAAKVSGKTIKNIFSVSTWSKAQAEMNLFEESDATTIKSKQTLFGKDFKTDDNGDVDTTTFILSGVESLDKIAVDNVVYAYYDASKNIRKVEVGTQVVEGTLDAFSAGSKAVNGQNAGKQATFTIGDKDYKGTNANVADNATYKDWTLADDSDEVAIGDEVKAYLDFSGKIYKIEKTATASKDYAIVLDYDLTNDIETVNADKDQYKIPVATGLNVDDSLIKVKAADGTVSTLVIKDGATINAPALKRGDIITYTLNSSKKVKDIVVKGAVKEAGDKLNISKKGYMEVTPNGSRNLVLDDAVVFAIKKGKADFTKAIDEDNVTIVKRSAIVDNDLMVYAYNLTTKTQFDALVISDDVTSDDILYGIVTSKTKVDSDKYDGDYRVTVLVNGESKTYYTDNELTKNTLYAFKLDSDGTIGDDYVAVADDNTMLYDKANAYLGYMEVTAAGIKVSSGRATAEANGDALTSINLDDNVIYYNYDDGYKVGTKSDLTGADKGKYAYFFETASDEDDADGVADLVIIADSATRGNTLLGK